MRDLYGYGGTNYVSRSLFHVSACMFPCEAQNINKSLSSLRDLIAKHANGEVDAAWLCVQCVAKRQRRTDYGRVAREVGIYDDRQRRNAQNADRQKRYKFDLPSNGKGW